MEKKRVYSLDVLRVLLCIVIAFDHAEIFLEPGAGVAVLFFFVLSGFFLGKKFYEAPEEKPTAWRYTIDHGKTIFPHLVFSVTVYFLYRLLRYILVDCMVLHSRDWLFRAVKDLYLLIPEYSMLLSAYHKYMSPNFALWQLSAMLIAGYFIYALLHHNEKLARRILLPAAILMGESMNASCGMWDNVGPIYMPLVRALVPMCVGFYLYYFTTTAAYAAVKKHRLALDVATVLSLFTIPTFKLEENIIYLTIGIVILACWDRGSAINKLLNHRCFRRCGRLSLAIFLDHMMIARFVINPLTGTLGELGIILEKWQTGLVYLVLLMTYSLLSGWFVDKCTAAWKRKRQRAGKGEAE